MITILIAEDEQIEYRYLRDMFLKHPGMYRVLDNALTGRDAVDMAFKYRPEVVIMDISMPVCNGLEASLIIKEKLPDTIIMLNTAYAEFEFARKAVEYHLDAYLLKPSSEEEIFRTLEGCLRKRQSTASSPMEADGGPDMCEKDCIEPVAEYIMEHLAEDLSLRTLSEQVHFSPSYLSHLFHEKRGMTIRHFINQKRIEYSVQLLRHSDKNIKEIASACGFSNISHFNRVFKLHTGKTPVELRKENRDI